MILIAYAAPFAVFRDFSAGYLRPSFPFAAPSALYGLLLNIAGIEMRGELGPGPTETRAGLPSFRIASAALAAQPADHSFAGLTQDRAMPGRAVLFQQLHTIPVGSTSKERKPLTKGNKHHIAPARREILTAFRGLCAVDAGAEFEALLARQLDQPEDTLSQGEPRYGLPFLGDNNFFLEELSVISPSEKTVEWLVVAKGEEDSFPFRLTLWADRIGMKGTVAAMFAIRSAALNSPPPEAWVEVGPR